METRQTPEPAKEGFASGDAPPHDHHYAASIGCQVLQLSMRSICGRPLDPAWRPSCSDGVSMRRGSQPRHGCCAGMTCTAPPSKPPRRLSRRTRRLLRYADSVARSDYSATGARKERHRRRTPSMPRIMCLVERQTPDGDRQS